MKRHIWVGLILAVATLGLGTGQVVGQSLTSAEPFKVGTFAIGGTPRVGLVLRDELIVDIGAANAAFEQGAAVAALAAPADMLELIERYDTGLRDRLYAIVNELVADDRLAADNLPDFMHPLAAVQTLAPIQYPGKVMNAAVNFYTHACEGCSDEELARMTRERQENRGVPYLFLKPTRGAIIGDGDDIVIPYGRDRTDWEVEMGTVIGRAGKYISAR